MQSTRLHAAVLPMRRGACRLQLASEAMSNLTENSTSLAVAQNSVPTPISIATPIDDSYGTSALSVTVTEMPSDGAVLLADGVHPVTRRELDGRPTDWIGVSADLNAASLTSTFRNSRGSCFSRKAVRP
jgi:hypothetical protein